MSTEDNAGWCRAREDLTARMILLQAGEVAAGRRCDDFPELSRLLADARCAVSAAFPREFIHEGRRYRLGVRGQLFIYSGQDVPQPGLTPLLPNGTPESFGFFPR